LGIAISIFVVVVGAMDFMSKMTAAAKGDQDMWGDENMGSPGKAAGERKKRRGAPEAQGHSVQDLTMQLDTMKLVSNVAQKLRVHASVRMWTVMVPAALLQPAIDFAKDFGKNSKGKNMGSPHVQIWRIVLKTIITSAKERIASLVDGEEKNHLTQATTVIENHLQALIASGPKKGFYHVRQVMVRATRSEKESILKFEVSQLLADPRSTEMAVLYILEALEGRVLEGTEAATDLERKIQVHIAELKDSSSSSSTY